eukprot:3334570-Alexandrium_andersonii.AAC.1
MFEFDDFVRVRALTRRRRLQQLCHDPHCMLLPSERVRYSEFVPAHLRAEAPGWGGSRGEPAFARVGLQRRRRSPAAPSWRGSASLPSLAWRRARAAKAALLAAPLRTGRRPVGRQRAGESAGAHN